MASGGVFLLIWVLGAILSAGIGMWIADQKNRDAWEGALLGFFLGPIGWIIEALLPTGELPAGVTGTLRGPRDWSAPTPHLIGTLPAGSAAVVATAPGVGADGRATKRCPRCAEDVKAEALVCRFCGHEFLPGETPPAVESVPASAPTEPGGVPAPRTLVWPPGDWVTQPDWSPSGFYEVQSAVGREALPGTLGSIITRGAKVHVTPREDGSWLESDRGAGALVASGRDPVQWTTSSRYRGMIALATMNDQPLAFLRQVA